MSSKPGFKERLYKGEVLIGSWITFTDPSITEIMCGAGFDFLIIDTEHSVQNLETVQLHIIAMKGTDTTPIVRVPWNDQVIIKQVLDMGPAGVLVPLVTTREEARRAVASCLYPPEGMRGFGPRRPGGYGRHYKEYIKTANKNMVVLVQVEHIDAVNSIDEILGVSGIDAVCIGPCDLSSSLGLLGNAGHPKVVKAIKTIIDKSDRAGVAVGYMLVNDVNQACRLIKRGVKIVVLGSDMAYLVKSADNAVSQLRNLISQK